MVWRGVSGWKVKSLTATVNFMGLTSLGKFMLGVVMSLRHSQFAALGFINVHGREST